MVFVEGEEFVFLDGFEYFLYFLILCFVLVFGFGDPFGLFSEKTANVFEVEFGVKGVFKEFDEIEFGFEFLFEEVLLLDGEKGLFGELLQFEAAANGEFFDVDKLLIEISVLCKDGLVLLLDLTPNHEHD